MFGEKEWSSVSQRFLPDRPTTVISHRYAKLCVLMYKACGIYVNDITGDLARDVCGDTDHLTPVNAPAKFNVNRWSFEEDIVLLKAVPILGHSWAEINSKWMKHRNRGHLRKRYQVLERRIKGAVKREASSKEFEAIKKQGRISTATLEGAATSSSTMSSSLNKIKFDSSGKEDFSIRTKSSTKSGKTKTVNSKDLPAHPGGTPNMENNVFYHPYPYYGTAPYYHPYYYPPHYPLGAMNFCADSAATKASEMHPFSSVLKSQTRNYMGNDDGAVALDPTIKMNEVFSQHNQTSSYKENNARMVTLDPTMKKKTEVFTQHKQTSNFKGKNAGMVMLDSTMKKSEALLQRNGQAETSSVSGKINNPSKVFPVIRSRNASEDEHSLLCYEKEEHTKKSSVTGKNINTSTNIPNARSRNTSEEEHSLFCYENEEALVKPLNKKNECSGSNFLSPASTIEASTMTSKNPSRFDKKSDPVTPHKHSLPFMENETPSQLIDIPSQMLDLFNGEDASCIGIEKIIEENETKGLSCISLARLAEVQRSGIIGSGRDLTHTSTNFDDVKNALILGGEEVSQLPQFTLEVSGLSFLGPFEYNGKSTHQEGSICDTKSIYAKVLERVKNKTPSDPEKGDHFTLEEKEASHCLNKPASQSVMNAQMTITIDGKEIKYNKSSLYADTTSAQSATEPQISLSFADLGDMELNAFACGEKTRDALESSSIVDR